ncbi:hypothetical protein PoB_006943000 [Plakobranchus ocellatus]|uniref:Uncharacterized protein n=1 Tax=Plakobranchus ocellatus TaxID=259542 RepID=A0AAV4DFP8_9GAST|nr:hypothetical protein PoB_006943000 [Plakobranchus ocellatus]
MIKACRTRHILLYLSSSWTDPKPDARVPDRAGSIFRVALACLCSCIPVAIYIGLIDSGTSRGTPYSFHALPRSLINLGNVWHSYDRWHLQTDGSYRGNTVLNLDLLTNRHCLLRS